MEFEVTEIKKLGYGLSQSLSLRLDAYMENVAQCGGEPPKARFTIHAVVPYSSEFGSVHIGNRFKFEKTQNDDLSQRVVHNSLNDILRNAPTQKANQ